MIIENNQLIYSSVWLGYSIEFCLMEMESTMHYDNTILFTPECVLMNSMFMVSGLSYLLHEWQI